MGAQVTKVLRMTDLPATLSTAVAVFAGTNIDDLIVLTVLFLSARVTGRPRVWQIWVGQYVGVGTLVMISAVAALGLVIVPDEWIGLLGLVPFALGLRGLVWTIRDHAVGDNRPDGNANRTGADDGHASGEDPPASTVATGLASVAGVTIANGADNISVYTPLFRTIGLTASLITAAVFAVLIGVLCLAGSWLGAHRAVIAVVRRYGHWIVPVVFMLIGIVIIIESGILARLG
jgi:cadmium resistance protein CadD (predicted permease)